MHFMLTYLPLTFVLHLMSAHYSISSTTHHQHRNTTRIMSDSVWDILFSPYADIYLPLWFESRGPTTATVNQPAHDQRDAFYTHKSAHEEEENADVELEMEEAKSKDDGIKVSGLISD